MFKDKKEMEEAMISTVAESKEGLKITDRIGLTFESCDFEEKSVTFRFLHRDYFANQFGYLAGAVITAILELSCGTLANAMTGKLGTVVSDLYVSFISSTKITGDVFCKATIIKEGRTVIRTKAEIFDPETGKVTVTASANSFKV